MPLSELLPKAVKTKLNSSSELPPLEPDSELAELLWENGQVVVQGQSHRGFRFFSSSSSSSKDIGPGGAAQYEEDLSPWPNLPVDDYGLEFLSDFAVPDGGADPARPARSEPGESSLVDPAGCPSQEEDHRRLPKRRRRGNSDGEDEKPSPSARRGRAAEVHNLSERRRRDRINEKLRALQELIPNCSKVDKASVLDDAIEYLKSLQMRVRVMSMGGGIYIPPMMIHPGMPPSHMGMGMGMRFGMAMVDPTSSPHVPWSYSPTAVPFVGGRHMYASPPISTPLPAAAPPARAETGGTHP